MTAVVLTEAQRRYLRTRAETKYKEKSDELTKKMQAQPKRMSAKDRTKLVADVNARLAAAGLDFTFEPDDWYGGYTIRTAEDRAADNELKASTAAIEEKIKQLRKLRDQVLDEVMLGTDAEKLMTMLSRIDEFN